MHLITKLEPNVEMVTDWELYELILFNLVQNSIKYNKSYDGDVVIAVKCKPLKKRLEEHYLDKELNAVLETIIVDTGVGIEEDRKDLLFIPFLELRNRIGIMKTQNDNIGLGLACSKDLCKKLGGDVILMSSNDGLTAFSFKIPIKLVRKEEPIGIQILSGNPDVGTILQVNRLVGSERPIPDAIVHYLEKQSRRDSSVRGENVGSLSIINRVQ